MNNFSNNECCCPDEEMGKNFDSIEVIKKKSEKEIITKAAPNKAYKL